MFVRNQWYPVAWDREVGRKPLGRTICGEPVAVYRKLDGAVVAMVDACPHRLFPMSLGLVEGDDLRCKYHGMKFDGSGRCIEMPGETQNRDAFCLTLYPVVERYRLVWVWIGEPAKADPALLPDLWPCEKEGWAFDGGVYHVKADYRLMIDNLMDLTHETYVHPSSIGQSELLEAPIEVTSDAHSVTLSRWMDKVEPPPFWQMNSGLNETVDRWQICRFLPPSSVMIDVGVAKAGQIQKGGDLTKGTLGIVVDVMSPETDKTHWYFWGMARNFHTDDAGFGARLKEAQGGVFMEDAALLEAQQRSIDALPERKLRAFEIDGGGMRARVLIERMLAAQSSPT
ncbi:MAG TPA: aromatic ring-hydroxylating dioxygenase subunit alpha [Caulobacteraceae bacterium]|nr:aromatic ring-hydroxylating dioxygenase subunit alpha [Caulobacteraceae bacterium]